MEIKELTPKDKDSFNKFIDHPLQSWEWGEFREKLGQKVIRAGSFEKGKLVSCFQLFFHQIPKTPYTVGYFPKGPLPDKSMVDFLSKTGKNSRAIFIKIEPNAVNKGQRVLKNSGLAKGRPIFTKYTSVIDLTPSEEELLKSFKPKTRYNIRLAQKHGLVVQEDNSEKAFNQYLKLLFETTNRQGFYAHNEKFHRLQWQILQPAGISHLLVAKHQGKILSAFLLFDFNQTLYYPYGASTREHKELMAPALLMWEAIRFGKKIGCKNFDLWGDLEPNPPPNHPYYGFHRFKEGFSPELVEFVGSYDLVISQPWYKFYCLADLMRWKILRLKAKIHHGYPANS